MATERDLQLGISWYDSAWIPILNPENVLAYFSQRTNPFYDRTCNNEVVKMQRLDASNLQSMTGVEYIVLHVQDPILYVIRKQQRHSPSQVTSIADYYILAGVVYQAPDLCSVSNSRMLSALHNFQSSFDEAVTYSRYHPSKGYWWQFKDKKKTSGPKNGVHKKKEYQANKEVSSLFQRDGVNPLLGDLSKKFPPQFFQQGGQAQTGQYKKSADELMSNEDPAEKKATASKSIASEHILNGSSGHQTYQGVKRSSGSDGTHTKQPPSKKKKL